MANIVAKSGPGYLQIFPCTTLSPDFYEVLPMKENNCTEYIPLDITLGGTSKVGDGS